MKVLITCFFSLFLFIQVQSQNVIVKGNIKNYGDKPLRFYKCYGDTLLLLDSTVTNKKGDFAFSTSVKPIINAKVNSTHSDGMYKIVLQKNQFFYVLYNRTPVEIKTLYQSNAFYNVATDSLIVLKSEDNKLFYEFQNLQQSINVANYWLLQMMRLFPLSDPFHKQIEAEYFSRYNAMEQFVKSVGSWELGVGSLKIKDKDHKSNMAAKIILAYYQPVNPDWKQPDPKRDSIIVAHYFEYFNPADSFYMNTNILKEKFDMYITMSTNKRDAYGQPIKDEMIAINAAQKYLDKTKNNQENFDFYLLYLLKKFKKEHKETTFLYFYDIYLKPNEGDCESNNKQFDWAREFANKLRNVSIGSTAPDFTLNDDLQLNGIVSDYTLILFWASWCPHCTQEVPKIKKIIDDFNQKGDKKILTVAVSLDTDKDQWQKFVKENSLLSFLNFSEFKGWKSDVVKKYNVYATPSMFLLDKDKKIIAKPELSSQLLNALAKIH